MAGKTTMRNRGGKLYKGQVSQLSAREWFALHEIHNIRKLLLFCMLQLRPGQQLPQGELELQFVRSLQDIADKFEYYAVVDRRYGASSSCAEGEEDLYLLPVYRRQGFDAELYSEGGCNACTSCDKGKIRHFICLLSMQLCNDEYVVCTAAAGLGVPVGLNQAEYEVMLRTKKMAIYGIKGDVTLSMPESSSIPRVFHKELARSHTDATPVDHQVQQHHKITGLLPLRGLLHRFWLNLD
jgi:hypothetical protein